MALLEGNSSFSIKNAGKKLQVVAIITREFRILQNLKEYSSKSHFIIDPHKLLNIFLNFSDFLFTKDRTIEMIDFLCFYQNLNISVKAILL